MPEPVLVTAPTALPLTVEEVKRHLRLIGTGSDAYLVDLIRAAVRMFQEETGVQLVTATYDLTFDSFYPDFYSADSQIVLIPAPLQSVTSITYIDPDGNSQTLPSSDYEAITTIMPGRIRPVSGKSWPATKDTANAVTVRFVAGYGGPEKVPEEFKQALRVLIGHWYENAEAVADKVMREVPLGWDRILNKAVIRL